MQRARIGFVEDDGSYRSYFQEILLPVYDVQTWHSAETFLSDSEGQRMDLLCVDLELPHMSGLDLIRRVRQDGVNLPILVISSLGSEARIVEAIESGAMGYLFKSDDESLKDAISTLLAGGALVSSTIMVRLVQSFQKRNRESWRLALSDREVQIVELLIEGRSRSEAGRMLGTSEQTVKSQIASIYRKLQVSNRVELIRKVGGM